MVKKVLVTGASSFLGQHVIPKLNQYATFVRPGARAGYLKTPRFEILTPSSKELNLLNVDGVKDYMVTHQPDTILHMAARCGGIGANKDAPAEFMHDNMKMTANLFDGIRYVNEWGHPTQGHSPPEITHFYGLGSVCGYPKFCPVPFKEDDLWNGFPEETNAPYGQAKRSMLLMQQAFRKQFGLKGAHLIPVNMYGECFSKDTRLATPSGWKNVADFEVGDEIWTLNPETHKTEKETVTAVQKRKSKKFVNFKGSVIDLRVTPEHKIYYKTNKTFMKRKAEWFIPRAGRPHGMIRFAKSKGLSTHRIAKSKVSPFEGIITDDVEIKEGMARSYKHSASKWVPLEYDSYDLYEFIGWYVSEGSVVDATNQISISQSLKNPHHRDQIKALLTRMGLDFSFDDHRFYFSSKLWKSFIETHIGRGSDQKKIPDFVMESSTPEFLEVLFDALMKGDGDADGSRYTTKSTTLKDQFLILTMLTGRTLGKVYLDENDCWRIPLRASKKNSVKYRDIEVEELDEEEDVFCVTAGNNHIVYAERNNKPCWVGQCDHFDLRNSHVIPALIRKFLEAKESGAIEVEVWGDGSPTREFLYAGDCAEAIAKAIYTEFNYNEPVNLGTGVDISIRDLAFLIKDIVQYEGALDFTGEVSVNGQPKRRLDVSRAKEVLGFTAQTSLEEGLKKTVAWYKESQHSPGGNVKQSTTAEKTASNSNGKPPVYHSMEWNKKMAEVTELIKNGDLDNKREKFDRLMSELYESLPSTVQRRRRNPEQVSLEDRAPVLLQNYLKELEEKYEKLEPEQTDIGVDDMHQHAVEGAFRLIEQSERIKDRLRELNKNRKLTEEETLELMNTGRLSIVDFALAEKEEQRRKDLEKRDTNFSTDFGEADRAKNRIFEKKTVEEAIEDFKNKLKEAEAVVGGARHVHESKEKDEAAQAFIDAQKAVKEAFNYDLQPGIRLDEKLQKELAKKVIGREEHREKYPLEYVAKGLRKETKVTAPATPQTKKVKIPESPHFVQEVNPELYPGYNPDRKKDEKVRGDSKHKEVFIQGLRASRFSEDDIEKKAYPDKPTRKMRRIPDDMPQGTFGNPQPSKARNLSDAERSNNKRIDETWAKMKASRDKETAEDILKKAKLDDLKDPFGKNSSQPSPARNIRDIRYESDVLKDKAKEARFTQTPLEARHAWEKACTEFNKKFLVKTSSGGVFKILKADPKKNHKRGSGFVMGEPRGLKDFEIFLAQNEKFGFKPEPKKAEAKKKVESPRKVTILDKARKFATTVKSATSMVAKAAKELTS